MTGSKSCENRKCRRAFTRRHGEDDAKWVLRRFCTPKCAVEHRGKERTPKVPDTPDLPTHPVPAGQVWRPVGFPPVPNARRGVSA